MSLPGNLDLACGEYSHRLRVQNQLEGALHTRCAICRSWSNALAVEVRADKLGSERGGVVRPKIREGLLEVGLELGRVLGDGWGGVGHCRVPVGNSGCYVRRCFISTLVICLVNSGRAVLRSSEWLFSFHLICQENGFNLVITRITIYWLILSAVFDLFVSTQ